MKTPRHQPRRGFVLLLVLLLLGMAAALMSGLAARSLKRASESMRAEGDLQRHWGVTSLQAAVFNHGAETLLKEKEKQSDGMVSATELHVLLGCQAFTLRVSDESAKVNINAVYDRRGLRDAETAVQDLLAASNTSLAAQLTPTQSEPGQTDGRASRGFGSLEQVLKDPPVETLADPDRVGSLLTCWGDGTLNAGRASRETLRVGCAGILNESNIDQLIRMRTPDKPLSIEAALRQMQLPKDKSVVARRLLDSVSHCHSVWIIDRTTTRVWYDFVVQDDAMGGQTQWETLSW